MAHFFTRHLGSPRRLGLVLLIGMTLATPILPLASPARATMRSVRQTGADSHTPPRSAVPRHAPLLAAPNLPLARTQRAEVPRASLPQFPPGYAPNVNDIDQSGFSGDSQTSDPMTGWGDDVWRFSFTHLMFVTVEVDDCCLVGDNYEIYITRTLTQTEDLIGVTPAEDINGTTLSTGTFSKLVAPGAHYVAIRDPGGVYWYSQGYTELANPAGYTVKISFQDATQGNVPGASHTVIYVHGIIMSAASPGFAAIHDQLRALYGDEAVHDFTYVDDKSLTDQSACRRYTSDGCVSQSAMLPNAIKLAAEVKQDFAQSGNHKVTLIGYSQGAAIIRTMLAGCQSEVPNASSPGCGGVESMVDNVFFIDGVQQGSWLVAQDPNLTAIVQEQQLNDIATLAPLLALKTPMAFLMGLNLQDPAERDLAPQSANIRTRNQAEPPRGIHYFNFYGDIRVQQQLQVLVWGITPQQTISIGDFVVLPGSDNPQDTSFSGGARFCLRCADRGGYMYSSIDSSTTYTEWALTDTIQWNPNLLLGYLSSPLATSVYNVILLGSIATAPEMHTNMPSDASLNSVKVQDATGLAGKVTIPQEIVLQLEVEDGIEP